MFNQIPSVPAALTIICSVVLAGPPVKLKRCVICDTDLSTELYDEASTFLFDLALKILNTVCNICIALSDINSQLRPAKGELQRTLTGRCPPAGSGLGRGRLMQSHPFHQKVGTTMLIFISFPARPESRRQARVRFTLFVSVALCESEESSRMRLRIPRHSVAFEVCLSLLVCVLLFTALGALRLIVWALFVFGCLSYILVVRTPQVTVLPQATRTFQQPTHLRHYLQMQMTCL